jgi:peptidoglycan/LPS O-acetylase OafA/YrhL
MEKVKGLNSIRAICALWVVMNHLGGPPLTEGIDESNIIAKIFSGIFNNLWNGPAAVIVFFVISGFCIHYPNVKTLRIPSLGSYFLRRYLRVGVPLLIVIYISKIFKVEIYSLNDSILWSLFAELIYYTLYPALLIFRRRFLSWVPLISFVFLIAFLIAFTKPTAGNYASFGVELNWLLGLPCWLGGCLLAELIASKNTSSFTSKKFIILLRSFVFGMAVFFSILRWHSPVGYPWTLNIFGNACNFLAYE